MDPLSAYILGVISGALLLMCIASVACERKRPSIDDPEAP